MIHKIKKKDMLVILKKNETDLDILKAIVSKIANINVKTNYEVLLRLIDVSQCLDNAEKLFLERIKDK